MVDGIVGPQTRAALGLERVQQERGRPWLAQHRVAAHPRRIAECESGGDPTALSPSGRYRGKYQFSMSTWSQMGGEGDPAEASEWVQDRIALKLYRRAGTSPWPNCP